MEQKTEKSVAVIISVFNGMAYLPKCLELLRHASHPHTVIVVDDGSNDGTVGYVKNQPDAVLLQTKGGLGYGGTMNAGFRYALDRQFDYCLTYGADVEAPAQDKGWLGRLVAKAESDQQIGIVAAKLLYPDGRLQSIGMRLGEDAKPVLAKEGEEPFFLPYSCALIKKQVLQDIGLLDEQYYLYYEDVDHCAAARWRGWKLAAEPGVVLVHHEGKLSGGVRKAEVFTRARRIFIAKWGFMLEPGWESLAKGAFQPATMPKWAELDRIDLPSRKSRDGKIAFITARGRPGATVNDSDGAIAITVPGKNSFAGFTLALPQLGSGEHCVLVEARGSSKGLLLELDDAEVSGPADKRILDSDYVNGEYLAFQLALPEAETRKKIALYLTTYKDNLPGTLYVKSVAICKRG